MTKQLLYPICHMCAPPKGRQIGQQGGGKPNVSPLSQTSRRIDYKPQMSRLKVLSVDSPSCPTWELLLTGCSNCCPTVVTKSTLSDQYHLQVSVWDWFQTGSWWSRWPYPGHTKRCLALLSVLRHVRRSILHVGGNVRNTASQPR